MPEVLRILVAPGEKLGFRVNPALEVLLVVPGGPADDAKIRLGDKVEEIDKVVVGGANEQDRWRRLTRWRS